VPPAQEVCLLVDTDAGLDDFRALAALLPHQVPAAVVVTEGIASAPRGALAVALVLAAAVPGNGPPLIVGDRSPSPIAPSWLAAARDNAERLNGFLPQALALPRWEQWPEVLARALEGCQQIRLVQLGPWTSFARYRHLLDGRLTDVVVQGPPPDGDRPAGFNCRYDRSACREASRRLGPQVTWVDLPESGPAYGPTMAMLTALPTVGLPGLLRATMVRDPGPWEDTEMCDDAVAVFLAHPEVFERRGSCWEPRVSPDELRQLWQTMVVCPARPSPDVELSDITESR
jgi:hypothetical protein